MISMVSAENKLPRSRPATASRKSPLSRAVRLSSSPWESPARREMRNSFSVFFAWRR